MHVHLVELEAMQNVSSLQNGYTACSLNSQEDIYYWIYYLIIIIIIIIDGASIWYVDHLEMELDDTETSVGNFTWPDSIAWHGDWIAVCHTQTVMFTEETEEMSGALFWDHFLLHAYFGPWGVNEKKEIQHTGIRNALTPRHFEACMEPIRPADI